MTPVTGGSTANLWIDTNGGTCTRQSTAGAYSDSAACSSMQAAVAASSSGDTIRMKAGSYGSQSISTNRSSPGVTLIGEQSGNTNAVSIGGLTTQGNWVTVRNVDATSGGFSDLDNGNPTNVRWENVNIVGGGIFIDGGTNFTWQGGSYHDYLANGESAMGLQGIPPSCAQGAGSCTGNLTNITIDGVYFHDIGRTAASKDGSACGQPGSPCHNETIRIDNGVDGVTIKNSTFDNVDPNSGVIFVGDKNFGLDARNVTIEQNFFGTVTTATNVFNSSASTNMPCLGFKFLYNTFTANAAILDNCGRPGTAAGDAEVRGNLGRHISGCNARVTSIVWDKNVWSDSSCGGTDIGNQTMGFAADGFHITGSSAARGNGSSTYCPATDIDGEGRPQGAGNCDAGADEVP